MKPRDWIAITVISSFTFLTYSGFESEVMWYGILTVIAFYFGHEFFKRRKNGSSNDPGLLHEETGKR